MSFFNELKRRNVYRAGAAYIVVSWLIIQVVETIFPAFGFGDSAIRIVVIAFTIGLVPVLIFAWLFELTLEGLKRDFEVDRTQSITPHTGKKLDRAIIVMLTLAVVYFAFDEFIIDSEHKAGMDTSIAVLPFRNRSAVAEDVYFVDGRHDDILTQLANLSGLDKVISRTSMEQYRGTTKPMPQIGRELGVATILEGGVQRAGDRVRINMQLINAETDEHLWAATFDRELTVGNLFDIQSEISREIVDALQAVLSDQDDTRLRSVPTISLEAYGEYVLGRKEMAKRTAHSLAQAQSHFERAIDIDPDYAIAYVGLADTFGLQSEYAGKTQEETFESRQAAIDQALELDPYSGEAYASLGDLLMQQGKLESAESNFLKSIELSPNYATAYHWYGNLLREAGRNGEALVPIRKALEIDPAAPVLTAVLSAIFASLSRFEEAQEVLNEGIARNPEYPGFFSRMSTMLARQGRLGEAAIWMRHSNQLNGSNFYNRAFECRILIDLDEADSAQICLDDLRQAFPGYPEKAFARTVVPLNQSRGQSQVAIDYLENLIRKTPDMAVRKLLADAWVMNAEWRKARPVYEILAPSFYEDEKLVVDRSEVIIAIDVAATLRDGDKWEERAHLLAGQALRTMQTMSRVEMWDNASGIGYGFWDVLAHGIRGDDAKALAALRDAIVGGWRIEWWILRMPAFGMLQTEPDWDALIAELEADITTQRQWYQEHRDEPLF